MFKVYLKLFQRNSWWFWVFSLAFIGFAKYSYVNFDESLYRFLYRL